MNKKKLLCALLLSCSGLFAQNAYDLVIVGGNPGGIMAAISAARMGKHRLSSNGHVISVDFQQTGSEQLTLLHVPPQPDCSGSL